MEDGGYGHDTLKIKNEKSVDNFRIRRYTNRRKDLLTQNPFLILEVLGMKLLKITADGLPLFKEKLDICFYAQQRVSEDQKDILGFNVIDRLII
jgi:hypothetical protein